MVDVGARGDDFREAAVRYPRTLDEAQRAWLHRKPFDPSPGNAALFDVLIPVLHLLEAMRIKPGGRVLEVGSGPGWLSEWLLLLGFSVDGVEPAPEMISVAEERIRAARQRYGLPSEPSVAYHATTLEQWQGPAGSFDAVIFQEALHHLMDERAALVNAFEALRPGGVLGITEAAWSPGFIDTTPQEEEMARFGTLESPFTPEYLDYLLRDIGWVDIERFHAIRGFVPESRALRVLAKEMLRAPLGLYNHVVARRPADCSAD